MKIHTGYISIVILLMAIACSSNMESPVAETPSDAAQVVPALPTTAATVPASVPTDLYSDGFTKLIKTANYRFEVDNMQKSIAAIETAVRKHNAFISSSDLRLYDPMMESKMKIRVQSDHFQDLLKEIDMQARFVNYRDIKTEDVSKQFVDLESRLRTKREVEQRYMEILRKKAGTIEELLKAEQQIGELHEEIEATVSRINFLRDEVRYSTVNLELYQRVEHVIVDNNASEWNNMRDALASGWKGLVIVFTAMLYLWPLLVITGVGIMVYRISRKGQIIKGA